LQAGSKWTESPGAQGVAMTAIRNREEEAMAISFPAPEVGSQRQLDSTTAERTQGPSFVAQVGRLLKSGYDRACSAIFESDGDCMRF
jgi:hypothetical protein